MRKFHGLFFGGAGDHSIWEANKLRQLLEDSIIELGGMQQGGTKEEQDTSREVLEDAVKDFAAALLGRNITIGEKLPYPSDPIPVIDSKVLHEMEEEAREWRQSFRRTIRAMENITSEDWRTRVR